MIRKQLCVWLAAVLALSLAGMCSAQQEAIDVQPAITVQWLDETGEMHQVEAVWTPEEDAEGYYRADLDAADLPTTLTVLEMLSEDGEPGLIVPAYQGDMPDGGYLYSLQGEGPSPFSALMRVYTQLSADTAPAPGPTPDSQVTVVVHYESADGEPIADDEVFFAKRGTQFQAYSKTLEEGWKLVGDPILYVDIPLDAPDTVDIVFQYTRPTPTPAPPDVRVTIRYRDEGGAAVAEDTVIQCPGGTEQEIYAEPVGLKENYYPYSDSVQRVQINGDGTPQEVTFYYAYRAPATPAPAYAVIQYVNADGMAVAQETTMTGTPGQEMNIFAAPEQLMDYYVLDDEEPKVILLPQSGETVTVTFLYRLELPATPAPTDTPEPVVTATPQPAPGVGFVQVSYVYQGDESLSFSEAVTVTEGNTYLNGLEGLRSGYHLISAEEVLVTVDAAGNVTPNRVTFVFAPDQGAVEMPELVIYYQAEDDGAQVASATLMTLRVGENTVYASPVDLADGYEQITPSYTVTVDENGNADAQSVIFYYRKNQDGGRETGFQMLPASGYARSNNNGVNLRSYPSTSSDSTIIAKINRTDIIEILGRVSFGGEWFYVNVNERRGYVSATVVTVLPDEEAAVLMSLYRGEGGDGDSVVNPETGLIERWARVIKSNVRFRKKPNGDVIMKIKKNEDVFVDDATDENGTLWYRIRYKGKEGYIMADCLTLYSAVESQNIQFQLPTPVPTHTVPATRVPTSTPTAFIPTPTPTAVPVTPTPVLTSTPQPYTGYAVTNTRATVHSGWTADNSVLLTLNGETLVMIQGQTYVNNVCWDSIRVISSGVTGFVQDDRLQHISNEVAQEYLLYQATPTPAPTPDNTPLPFTGYAVILMNGVPMRQQTNSNAQYLAILDAGTVVSVLNQSTAEDGTCWCLIQYGQYLGFVRRDLLRQMSGEEILTYMETISSRPTATPEVTATPRAQSAMMSCWGIISRDRVSLRSLPSITDGTALRLMNRNEFVQIQGSFLGDDSQVWQQVLYSGQVGYLRADWVQVLTQGELTRVVTSDDFKSANTTDSSVTGADSIQSYENYLVSQWTNPSVNASYEPFDPYTTPVAVVAAAQTPEPKPTSRTTEPPKAVPTIINNMTVTPPPNASGGSGLTAVLIAAGLLAVGGGVVFSAAAVRSNKRRQALQRAQAIRRRQQREQDQADREPVRPRSYRRDSAGGIALEGTARPVPREEAPAAPDSGPMGGEDEGMTRAFRRPQPVRADATTIYTGADPANAPPASGPAGQPVRRRRTERNHYDEDGN